MAYVDVRDNGSELLSDGLYGTVVSGSDRECLIGVDILPESSTDVVGSRGGKIVLSICSKFLFGDYVIRLERDPKKPPASPEWIRDESNILLDGSVYIAIDNQ